jgi:metallo-beta-lactamase class B
MQIKSKVIILLGIIPLFYLNLAQAIPADWLKPFPPFQIAGNLYYVGSTDLASYLIVTPKGNILINSAYPTNVSMIKKSIEQLGFNYKNTKILLVSHVHSDHAAGSALIKRETNAQYWVMAQDVSVAETGGKNDFLFGNDPEQQYQATKVNHTLHDGEKVSLGGTTLMAHLTPGHSKGCTTWTLDVKDHGKTYHTVIVGGLALNPGTKLVNNKAYPNITKDYKHTWSTLHALPCDIFLGAHGIYFDLKKKYIELKQGVPHPFVDTKGYLQFIAKQYQIYSAELQQQRSSTDAAKSTYAVN